MARITAAHRLTEKIAAFEIEAPEVASASEAGQVVLLRFDNLTEQIPKEIADVDRAKGTLTILSRGPAGSPLSPASARPTHDVERKAKRHRGAAESSDEPGDHEAPGIEISGPLGRRKADNRSSKVLFVAEGTGIGAILPRLRDFKENGCYTMVIAGYPSKTELFWVDRLDQTSDELYVVTDDGSYGIKGPIRHTLRAVCEQVADIDRVFTVGSLKLLKTAADVTRNFNIATTASLAAVLEDTEETVLQTPAAQAIADETAASGPAVPAAAAREHFDWEQAVDVDAHTVDFDALARTLGIPITR